MDPGTSAPRAPAQTYPLDMWYRIWYHTFKKEALRDTRKVNKRCIELFEKAKNNPAGLRFDELQKLCKCAGMWLDRTKSSHHIYKHNSPSFTLSIQDKDGKAKPYQVKQLLDFIEDNNLDKRSEDA